MQSQADAQPPHSRFRLAMDAAGIGMGVVAPDGRWQEVNAALAELLARSIEELPGQPAIDAFHPDERERTSAFFSGLQPAPGARAPFDTRLVRSDGDLIEVVLDAVREAGVEGCVIVQVRDIGALRRAAEAEHEARVANERLQALAYGISHDMRAPLRAIDGSAGKLARQLGDQLEDSAQDALDRIRHATVRMGDLIDGLLELARVGRAELRPAQVDISLLADWCAAELQDANPGREASIEVQQGLQVVGDERLLKSMLKRVLENAWRFSATRPQVEISVTGERLADGLRLWIRDRGIGFDMAYANKLFIPFQRLHGAEDGAGSGIGLTIAEQIAERHNGYIRGDAVVGEGAIFEIELADLSTGETT